MNKCNSVLILDFASSVIDIFLETLFFVVYFSYRLSNRSNNTRIYIIHRVVFFGNLIFKPFLRFSFILYQMLINDFRKIEESILGNRGSRFKDRRKLAIVNCILHIYICV